MEDKSKKSLTALFDEKIKEKANESAQQQTGTAEKPNLVKNAFNADFFKANSKKNANQNIRSETEFDKTSANISKENSFNIKNLLADSSVTNKPNQEISLKYQPSVMETPNYDFIEASGINSSDIKQKNKSKKRFRAKLSLITYSIIFLICSCWTISNAIELSNTARNISEINYHINEIQYLIKIEQLDNYNNGENPEIVNIIEITPPALVEPTQIQPITNWFDRICAWLSGLFK
ncbi:MAG: hypothetical protein PHR96_01480 [Clostridia bacterium]|nr:hypothetical protein [Clostridia bacterium]